MKHNLFHRLAALLLSLLMLGCLAACGDSNGEAKDQPSKTQGSFAKEDLTKKNDPDNAETPEDPANPDTSEDPNASDTPETPDTPDTPDTPKKPNSAIGSLDITLQKPEEHTYSDEAQAALDGLYLCYAQERFAASYLGYREEGDTRSVAEWMYDNTPMQASFWPFLLEIPEEDVIGEYGDVYCVIPMDGSLTFTVKSVEWETEGNGSVPHYSEPVYYAQIDRPFLLYITHTQWRDETSLTVEYVDSNGFVRTWCPTYDAETGNLDAYTEGNILDFAAQYDIGDYIPHLQDTPDAGAEWLPPTELALVNTTWYTENGWMLAFGEDGSAEDGMVLYAPEEGSEGTVLTPYYQGTWWLEDDSLCLGVYDGHCPFPLLISPDWKELVIMQSDDGSVLPFFQEGQSIVGLTLGYG